MANFYAVDAASSGGGSGSGIQSINGDTTSAQLIVGAATPNLSATTSGGTTTINQHVADSTHNGYLASTDWIIFDAKQDAGNYITSLTGDVTATGPGAAAASFVATTNATLVTASALVTSSAGTIVTRTSVDQGANRLENKDLDPSIRYVDSADTTKYIQFTMSGNTTNTGLTLHSATTVNRDITFPDASVTLQGAVTIGALDAQAENANGLALVSNVLSAQSADATHPGMVNITTQTFAGNKTFSGTIGASNFSGTSSGTNTGDQTITLTGAVTGSGTGSFATSLVATTNATLTTLSALTTASALTTVGNITTGTWAATNIPIARGGTGQNGKTAGFDALSPMSASGDIIYGGTSGTGTTLVGNTTPTKNFLTQSGNGFFANAPAWGTIASADVTTAMTPTNMSDALATMLGLKEFVNGNTYNSVTINITGITVRQGILIPYMMQSGNWRMRFNINGTISSSPGFTITINGILFKNSSSFSQAVSISQENSSSTTMCQGDARPNTGNIIGQFGASVTDIQASGDVWLDGKPSWVA